MFIELAQYNYPPSLYYIGLCYLNGTGVAQNHKHAFSFINNAAKRGNTTAQYDLAVMIENGIGTEKNDTLAHEYFASAAAFDEPRALVEMYSRYLNGKIVGQDKETAEVMLKKAAEQQYPPAMLEYGMFLMNDGRDGIKYIKAAAKEKLEEAMLYMYDYEHKAGNYKKAYTYAKELHHIDSHEGTRRMADCYYNGWGVSRDKRLAKDLYREAAAAGNAEAREILKGL